MRCEDYFDVIITGSKQSSTAACVDRLMSSSLEVLNGIFVLSTEMETQQKNKVMQWTPPPLPHMHVGNVQSPWWVSNNQFATNFFLRSMEHGFSIYLTVIVCVQNY